MGDTSALASQNSGLTRSWKNWHRWCEHCHKDNHTTDRCWKINGKPPDYRLAHSANVASSSIADKPPTTEQPWVTPATYDDFLRWCESRQNSGAAALVAQSGNSFACISQFPTPGPWVLDSSASDHIFGNHSLFSSLSMTGNLPIYYLYKRFPNTGNRQHPSPTLPYCWVYFICTWLSL